jgi:hypothetical protein
MATTCCVVTQKSAALRRDARQQATPISVRQKSDVKIMNTGTEFDLVGETE